MKHYAQQPHWLDSNGSSGKSARVAFQRHPNFRLQSVLSPMKELFLSAVSLLRPKHSCRVFAQEEFSFMRILQSARKNGSCISVHVDCQQSRNLPQLFWHNINKNQQSTTINTLGMIEMYCFHVSIRFPCCFLCCFQQVVSIVCSLSLRFPFRFRLCMVSSNCPKPATSAPLRRSSCSNGSAGSKPIASQARSVTPRNEI